MKSIFFCFSTDADLPMERNSVCRRGLVASVARNAFLATMMEGITPVRMTEVRRAFTAGMVRTARCTVSLKTTTNLAITLVTTTGTKSALMASTDSLPTVL